MIKIMIDSHTGECSQENKGTAKELLIESLSIVQHLYSTMKRNTNTNLRMHAIFFRSMLRNLMDDEKFWSMEPDESVTIDLSKEENK